MTIKSLYHKTDEMGKFEGNRFYIKKFNIKKSDRVFVISAKTIGGNLTPFLEGFFAVSNVDEGDYHINGEKFELKLSLSTIVKPKEPINISSIQNRISRRVFASRFMNQVKPNLTNNEIDEFHSLLTQFQEKIIENKSSEDALLQDFNEILQSDTERSQHILARIGQGQFRKNVVSVWGLEREMCVLTGITLPVILTASHIVPWSECTEEKASMRLDGANGILLCANIDRLFDRYYISFLRKGSACTVKYSKLLSNDYINQLGLTKDLELVPNRMQPQDKDRFFGYIEAHYKRFLELEAERS